MIRNLIVIIDHKQSEEYHTMYHYFPIVSVDCITKTKQFEKPEEYVIYTFYFPCLFLKNVEMKRISKEKNFFIKQ